MSNILPNINKLMYHGWKLETNVTGFPPYPVCIGYWHGNNNHEDSNFPVDVLDLLLTQERITLKFKIDGQYTTVTFNGFDENSERYKYRQQFTMKDDHFNRYEILHDNGSYYLELDNADQGSPIYVIGGVIKSLLSHLYQCFSSLSRKWVRVC